MADSRYWWKQERVEVSHALDRKIGRPQLPFKLANSVTSVVVINDVLLSP